MLFMAEFGKHADHPERFRAALQPHLEYLRVQRKKILLSATRQDPKTDEILGFVWIIEADSAAEAESLCRKDPFWEAGLRTTFRLSSLIKAIPEQLATI